MKGLFMSFDRIKPMMILMIIISDIKNYCVEGLSWVAENRCWIWRRKKKLFTTQTIDYQLLISHNKKCFHVNKQKYKNSSWQCKLRENSTQRWECLWYQKGTLILNSWLIIIDFHIFLLFLLFFSSTNISIQFFMTKDGKSLPRVLRVVHCCLPCFVDGGKVIWFFRISFTLRIFRFFYTFSTKMTY